MALLPSLGHSPTSEIFTLTPENVVIEVAIALKEEKSSFFDGNTPGIKGKFINKSDTFLRELTLA